MNRRSFLKMFGSASVVAAAPTYFFAPRGGWGSATSYNYRLVSGLPPQEILRVYYEKGFVDIFKEQIKGKYGVIDLPTNMGLVVGMAPFPLSGNRGNAESPLYGLYGSGPREGGIVQTVQIPQTA